MPPAPRADEPAPASTDAREAPRAATAPPRREGGRPRDAAIGDAVLDAALALLDEVGYPRMTLDAVTRRAGTSKPTVYRRWPSLHALVVDALARRLGTLDAPDTGCTICDLSDALKLHVAAFRRIPPDAVAALLAECADDPERRAALLAALFDPPRAAAARTLEVAAARGDLRPGVDHALLLDLLGSLVHYRALFRHAPTSDAEIDRAVHTVLQGAATDYARLVEISRSRPGDPAFHHRHA